MDSIRNIAIFGATGMTGQCALDAALDLGLSVTVLVRDPSRLPASAAGRVSVVQGSVLDPSVVEQTVQGQDAVVIVLGNGRDLSPTTVLSEGTKNVLAAMAMYGVSRVSACMSAFLFYDDDKVPERYHGINDDHKRMLEALQSSDRDWIAVLPPHIAEGPGRGDYLVAHSKAQGRTIAKQDLGHFLVTCFGDPGHYRQTCSLCDRPQD